MSEYVGDDLGREDYNQNEDEGNLYRTGYRRHDDFRRGNYQQSGERGFMSEGDYDRGSPLSGWNTGYSTSANRETKIEGDHKGKGPRNYRRTDNRIQEDINDRLTDHPLVDASDVDVEVKDCEVTLTGTVDSREAKRRAEDIAESVSGVVNVENRLRVNSNAGATPPSIVTPY
jgi:osmotically-inducible protein OsmY